MQPEEDDEVEEDELWLPTLVVKFRHHHLIQVVGRRLDRICFRKRSRRRGRQGIHAEV